MPDSPKSLSKLFPKPLAEQEHKGRKVGGKPGMQGGRAGPGPWGHPGQEAGM